MKQMFDMSEKLNNQIRSMVWIQLAGMILHGNKSLVGDEEVISLSHAKFYVFSASLICFGKMNQSPTSNTVWEVKLTWYKKFITIQNFGHSWWWANGIRVEYFPRIHRIAALLQSPRVPVQNERRTRRIHRTDHLHVDVQRHLVGIQRRWTGTRNKAPNSFRVKWKRFSAGRWSFLGPGSEKKWYSAHDSKPQGIRDRVAELMLSFQKSDTQFTEPRVHCPEERSKAKVLENYQRTSSLMRERLKLFFAQLFLFVRSVFTEKFQICVKNTNLAMVEQGDFW